MKKCSIGECTKESLVRGWCSIHYQRWYKTGDPLTQPKHNHGRGNREDSISYRGMHRRIERDRGKASEHECSWHDCKKNAEEWAYDDCDEKFVTSTVGKYIKKYSLSVMHYVALCKRHHEYFDLLNRRGIELTEKESTLYNCSAQSSA